MKWFQGFSSIRSIFRRTVMTSATRSARNAFVQLEDDTNKLVLSFRYQSPLIKDRMFTLNRNQDECLDVALRRLKNNMEVIAKRKWNKKKTDETANEELNINIAVKDSSGNNVELFALNKDAFQTGHTLTIDSLKFPIIVNAPTVKRISLPKLIMQGFPIQAQVELQNANVDDCEFSWWKLSIKGDKLQDYNEEDVQAISCFKWLRIPNETKNLYVPTEDDINRRIMVICEPGEGKTKGVEVSAISEAPVTPRSENFPFLERHKLTEDVLPNELFRVVSYNLLADVYARTEFSRQNLFYYCPVDALDFNYRGQLLNKEIMGYNADIICLQEVDRGMFKHQLNPLLSLQGFRGIYSEKSGEAREGVTCFFRTSKFELVEEKSVTISQEIENNESLIDIKDAVRRNENLHKRLKGLPTVAQIIVLKHAESGRHLTVCNSHLYFHPDADHIRLLQALSAIRVAETTVERFHQVNSQCCLLFCGDFNSTPEFGIYKLFTNGHVPKDLEDWKSNAEEAVIGVNARISHRLKSACGTPDYTNYTVDFKGCLDYIFYSEGLRVESTVPLPPHSVVAHEKYRAIPSPLIPSDHLALVSTLSFVEK